MTFHAKRSKFGARKTVVDGITFDSKAEAKRWGELQLAVRAGAISELERQVRYDFAHNGVRIGFYKADFRYRVRETNSVVVEDVKGFRTDVFALKAKLMRAFHGVDVQEIGRGRVK